MLRKGILAIAAAALVVLIAPALAAGHNSHWLNHSGGGRAMVQDHRWITVNDTSLDGHEVWVRYNVWTDPDHIYSSTGRAPSGGYHREGSYYGITIRWFQVCISYEGCTGRWYHGGAGAGW